MSEQGIEFKGVIYRASGARIGETFVYPDGVTSGVVVGYKVECKEWLIKLSEESKVARRGRENYGYVATEYIVATEAVMVELDKIKGMTK